MIGEMPPGYDEWKTRAPEDELWRRDPHPPPPECAACDDRGCPECCETFPLELEDCALIDEEIATYEHRPTES